MNLIVLKQKTLFLHLDMMINKNQGVGRNKKCIRWFI